MLIAILLMDTGLKANTIFHIPKTQIMVRAIKVNVFIVCFFDVGFEYRKNKIRLYFRGLQLYYKKYGTVGQPIVILHGLLGMGDNWLSIAQKLAQNHILYVVDQRNHGKSFHSDGMNYELMAQDVHNLMTHEALENVILIGHSMGGKTAMMFANLYPHTLLKLIIVDIAPKQYRASHQHYFDAIKQINLHATSRKEIEDKLVQTIQNKDEVLFLLKNLYRTESGDFGIRFNLNAIENNYMEIVKAIKFNSPIDIPTLFVKGHASDYILDGDCESIKSHFLNATFETIENSGHWVHADNPIGFLTCITKFINS